MSWPGSCVGGSDGCLVGHRVEKNSHSRRAGCPYRKRVEKRVSGNFRPEPRGGKKVQEHERKSVQQGKGREVGEKTIFHY